MMRLRRRRQSGQTLVEGALMMPFTLFMILGILQLSLMQQARLLTQYAAYRTARSGALHQASCQYMTHAAVEGILPAFGRTDSASAIEKTWSGVANPAHGNPALNKTGALGPNVTDIVSIKYQVEYINGAPGSPYQPDDFDDPGHGQRLDVQVTYNYELMIPFANWMIHEMWSGANYFKDNFDMLAPARQTAPPLGVTNATRASYADDSSPAHGWRFFLPIPASSSMRMMSNPVTAVAIGGGAQRCP